MITLLNLAFGLLGGWLADYVARRAGLDSPIAVIIGVIVGIIVFLANLAGQIIT